MSMLSEARKQFHSEVLMDLLVIDKAKLKKGPSKGKAVDCASNADFSNEASRKIANHIADLLGAKRAAKLQGQTSGHRFEQYVANFVRYTFPKLKNVRPGNWHVEVSGSRSGTEISLFEQYEHTAILQSKSDTDSVLKASLGNDYVISPDVIVSRERYSDEELNDPVDIVGENVATKSSLRLSVGETRLLHASISCKWTMRSDRSQNARSEALNLIRNRKGRTPHIVAVVAEPTPSRLSSIALGTGDLDCVYHFALYELVEAVKALGQSEAVDLLNIMIEGKRLKDISDLPLDLAV